MQIPKTFRSLALATVLALVTMLGVQPASSFHSDLPIVHDETVPGSGAFGIRVDQIGVGDLIIDLHTTGPAAGSQISLGAGFFDSAQNLLFMFSFTGHTSPDRLIVSPSPLATVSPEGWDGDVSQIGEGLDVAFSTSEKDGSCTFACLGLNVEGAGAGPHYFIVWAGAVQSTQLIVRSAADAATVTTTTGPAHVIGDPEILDGSPDAQVQATAAPGVLAGAKVMSDASYVVEATQQLWGHWGASDFKLACQFALGQCIWGSQVTYECGEATGQDCSTTKISWDGPAGGGEGYTVYGILGGAPGTYSFNVDLKIDAYGPNSYDPNSGTWVYLGENYSFLSAADVSLPA